MWLVRRLVTLVGMAGRPLWAGWSPCLPLLHPVLQSSLTAADRPAQGFQMVFRGTQAEASVEYVIASEVSHVISVPFCLSGKSLRPSQVQVMGIRPHLSNTYRAPVSHAGPLPATTGGYQSESLMPLTWRRSQSSCGRQCAY